MAIDSEGHRRVMADFERAVREGGRPLVDGLQGRQSLELVRAIYASARDRQPVSLA
jgi:predicted dehydrogenase